MINIDARGPTRCFNRYVLPAVLGALPACATNSALSMAFLRARGAVPCGVALRQLAAWLLQLPARPVIVLAHGAFASDMVVLREELKREGVGLRKLVWMDTLHFFRHAFRGLHLAKYSLAHLAEHILQQQVQHDALSDCMQLSLLLQYALSRAALSGCAYFTCEEPLLLAPGVGAGVAHALCRLGKPDTANAMCLYLANGGTLEGVPQRQQILEYLERRWRGATTCAAPAPPAWCADCTPSAGGTRCGSTPRASSERPPPSPPPAPAATPPSTS